MAHSAGGSSARHRASLGEGERRGEGPLRANNSELLRDAVLSGVGIALVPDFSCAAALREGHLVPLLPQWRPVGFFGDAIYAIRPYIGTHVPRAVQCLVEYLRQRLASTLVT